MTYTYFDKIGTVLNTAGTVVVGVGFESDRDGRGSVSFPKMTCHACHASTSVRFCDEEPTSAPEEITASAAAADFKSNTRYGLPPLFRIESSLRVMEIKKTGWTRASICKYLSTLLEHYLYRGLAASASGWRPRSGTLLAVLQLIF